jgi:hypothetical protein
MVLQIGPWSKETPLTALMALTTPAEREAYLALLATTAVQE